MRATRSEMACEVVRLPLLPDLTDEARLTFKFVETSVYLEDLGLSDQRTYPCSCKQQPCDDDSMCLNRACQMEYTTDCAFWRIMSKSKIFQASVRRCQSSS